MKKALVLLVVLAMTSWAMGALVVDQWSVDQDNYNNTLSVNSNYGTADTKRAAKAQQETTWYGDWSDADLLDLKSQVDAFIGAGKVYGTDFWVEFQTATNDWGTHAGAAWTPRVSSFLSDVDWVEIQATNVVASTGQNWLHHTSGSSTTFWGLADIDNTAPVVGGWATPSTGSVISWNTGVVQNRVTLPLLNVHSRNPAIVSDSTDN